LDEDSTSNMLLTFAYKIERAVNISPLSLIPIGRILINKFMS